MRARPRLRTRGVQPGLEMGLEGRSPLLPPAPEPLEAARPPAAPGLEHALGHGGQNAQRGQERRGLREVVAVAREVVVDGVRQGAREQEQVDAGFLALPVLGGLLRARQLAELVPHRAHVGEGVEGPAVAAIEPRFGAEQARRQGQGRLRQRHFGRRGGGRAHDRYARQGFPCGCHAVASSSRGAGRRPFRARRAR